MPEERRERRIRWWAPLVALMGAAIVGSIAVGVMFAVREQPGPKPVEEALEEFGTGGAPATSIAGIAVRPPEGVYLVEGEGRETISFPPVEQIDGTTMPASIRHRVDGCFTFRIDYNEAHWQEWELCPEEDTLLETGGRTMHRWDFGVTSVDNMATFVCDPPVPFAIRESTSGDRRARACTATNDQVAEPTEQEGTLVLVGTESVEVGGETLEAVHVRQAVTFSGGQTGESHTELWFSASDWMPLRGERDVRIESDSPIGAVTYTEQGHWQLTAVEPAD